MSPTQHDSAAQRLTTAKAFVFDMDGTLVLGDRNNAGLRPLPGAVQTLAFLRERGIPLAIMTNGTTRTPDQYAAALAALGFPVTAADMFTPASIAAEVFRSRGHTRVMAFGGAGLTEPLRHAGIEIADRVAGSGADAVLAGWFREVTFADFEAACDAVWNGAKPYSCSQSLFFASADGRVLGTSRAISAVIRDLTGVSEEVVGKPSSHAMAVLATHLGVAGAEIAVVGDDPALEMTMANRAGALSVFVGTGVHDGARLTDDEMPALSLPDISALHRILIDTADRSSNHQFRDEV